MIRNWQCGGFPHPCVKSTSGNGTHDCFVIHFRRSQDLIDLLMHLADRGLVTQVQELLKQPIQNCPDFLSLALLQTNHPMTLFKQEVLSSLIPVFLANHANAAVILHHMWLNQVIRTSHFLLIRALSVLTNPCILVYLIYVMNEPCSKNFVDIPTDYVTYSSRFFNFCMISLFNYEISCKVVSC